MHAQLPPFNTLNFVREIAKDDWMAKGKTPEWYFRRGYDALCIITNECKRAKINPKRILDFGCGHGNVSRMLAAEFKNSVIVGQDVDADWLQWCSSVLGIEVVKSAARILEVQIAAANYDLIWVGSVFTHIPPASAVHLLKELRNALSKNGLLVLTTAGQIVRNGFQPGNEQFLERVAAEEAVYMYDHTGYGFAGYAHGKYENWGRALISFDWFYGLSTRLGMRLLGFQEGGWGMRQDVYSFMNK